MLYFKFDLYQLLTTPALCGTRDTTKLVQLTQIFYLIWRELLKVETSTGEALEGSETVHKFYIHAHNP